VPAVVAMVEDPIDLIETHVACKNFQLDPANTIPPVGPP
jgi:hypothetical protein